MTTYCYVRGESLYQFISDGPFGIGPDGTYYAGFYDGEGGTNYPPNWLQLARPADLAALGMSAVEEDGAWQDARYYYNSEQMVFENGKGYRRKVSTLKPMDQILALRIQELAAYRYNKEIGGLTLNGMKVQTDDRSKSLLNGAVALCQIDPTTVVRWKTDTGFLNLDAAQVIAIGAAVGQFVQGCFAVESEHYTNLQGCADAAALIAYDITVGWPA